MLHLGSTLLVSLTLYLSILDSLNEILKKISVIIENDSMHSADSTEWKLFFIFCRFQMTYIVKYVNAGSGRRTNSTPAGSVKGCSTESVSWASQMYTHPMHQPSNEPASKQAGVVRLVSVIYTCSILIHCFCLCFQSCIYRFQTELFIQNRQSVV